MTTECMVCLENKDGISILVVIITFVKIVY